MQKSRLFEVFDALPHKDVKQLQKFVASPIFNQRQHVIDLLDFLIVCKYKKQTTPLREEAFAHLFPSLAFDYHKLRLSMSLLSKVIEKFLIWQQLNEHPIQPQLYLSQAYRKLSLPRHFYKSISNITNTLQEHPLRDALFHEQQYQLFTTQFLFNSEQNRMQDLYLDEMQEHLDLHYLITKLKTTCFLLTHQNIYKKEYNFDLLPAIIQYIENSTALQTPALATYYYCYLSLIESHNEQHFQTFKNLIFEHKKLFPTDEIRDLFLLATNYCIQQLNKGNQKYAQQGLEIYKEGIKDNLLLPNGVLSHFTYRNIVAKAIVVKDFEWAAQFITQYKATLEPKHRENTYSFNLAWLEYERKNYDNALDLVLRTNFTDLLLNISAKTIALKIYYELGAFDLLYSHLDAMKVFLHRKKLIAYHKNNYLNTIKYIKKILDLPPYDKLAKQSLQQEIKDTQLIAEKKWLLQQLE